MLYVWNFFCLVGSAVLIGGYIAKIHAQVRSGTDVCVIGSDLSNSNNGLCSTPTFLSSVSLKEIKNFRDIASASKKIKPGLIFRTGSVSRATEEDAIVLRDTLNIKTFIDLRSDAEVEIVCLFSLPNLYYYSIS